MESKELGLYCIEVRGAAPESGKLETARQVYVVADSPEHAKLQVSGLSGVVCTFDNDKHESKLVGFGSTTDPKKSKIYH
ncbi:hypothetical protein [Acinetobacter phage ABPH49]|nr:hypothetical protein [Acinetobacter phage ABPH49]